MHNLPETNFVYKNEKNNIVRLQHVIRQNITKHHALPLSSFKQKLAYFNLSFSKSVPMVTNKKIALTPSDKCQDFSQNLCYN